MPRRSARSLAAAGQLLVCFQRSGSTPAHPPEARLGRQFWRRLARLLSLSATRLFTPASRSRISSSAPASLRSLTLWRTRRTKRLNDSMALRWQGGRSCPLAPRRGRGLDLNSHAPFVSELLTAQQLELCAAGFAEVA